MYENINEQLFDFLEASPTAFHAVANLRAALTAHGYEELEESTVWSLKTGGKYFTVRNESALIAFRLPKKRYTGYMIAASHADSPVFKVKANPEIEKEHCILLNVERYGGMLMNPWFDRPLSVAGRLLVKGKGGTLETKLVNVDRDLLIIPSLAIHMMRDANDGHALNPQTELLPVYGGPDAKGTFAETIAHAANVKPGAILSGDLTLYVRGRGAYIGASNEYISSGRLDDLQCTFGDLTGFLDSEKTSGSAVPVLAVFDNEEVGSRTKQGADSTFLGDTLTRIADACGKGAQERRALAASSFMISADNAHAVHPNYAEKADPVNRPRMNGGIVIKYSANQKYTTDAVSAAIMKELCEKAKVPFQTFTNRSDMLGGSTLGNISNAHVSLNTVDIGLAQLAMHSPWETAGAEDTAYLARVMKTFFSLTLTCKAPGSYQLK